jgi:inorganic pyrophosphatase
MGDGGASRQNLFRLLRPHPWHGVALGAGAPELVTAYVEIVPTDTVKYEIEKSSGYLRIDRPQKFSSLCPTLYGFLPQTYCGRRIGELAAARTGRAGLVGDGDPLDVCVLSEKSIPRGDVLVSARPVGGLRLLDHGEADDKLVAVLEGDAVYGGFRELAELPAGLVDRLRHYFLTYKSDPDEAAPVEIAEIYGRDAAFEVIETSRRDYRDAFGDLEALLAETRPR